MPISRTDRERPAGEPVAERGWFALTVLALAMVACGVACGSEGCSKRQESAVVQDAVSGGPAPALFVTQAQFRERQNAELFAAWEAAVDSEGKVLRPVTVKEYRWANGGFETSTVGTLPDRQLRSMAAGDVKGDGTIAIVAGALSSGLWLFEREGDGWKKSLIDANSSGFEHPVYVTDLDGDGKAEIYVGSEDQHELRQYRWEHEQFVHTVVAPLAKDDITWNITSGTF